MTIAEVLRRKGSDVATALTTDQVKDAVRQLAERRIGAVVVEDPHMKMAGIFSERDLVNALARHGTDALGFQVSRLMSAPVVTCQPSDRADVMLSMMTMRRIRHLPVVEDGKLAGIVSLGDLVKHRLDEKEHEANVLIDIARMRG